MTQDLPSFTPEQFSFAFRMGRHMAQLVERGEDLRQAERVAARLVADDMRGEGADHIVVEALLADALGRSDVGQMVKHSEVPASLPLQRKLIAAFKAAGGQRFSPIDLLIEKRVATKTGYPLFLYSNESQHPGRPHVTIVLGDERVNVTIDECPEVLAGNRHARGLTAGMKAIAANHAELRKEWDETRPDDQKLENSKRRKKAAATEASGKP